MYSAGLEYLKSHTLFITYPPPSVFPALAILPRSSTWITTGLLSESMLELRRLASPLSPLPLFPASLSLVLYVFVVADKPRFIVVAYSLLNDRIDLWKPPDAHDWIIPTAVDYDENGQTIWGNTAALRPNPHVWFKLLIHSSPVVHMGESNLVGAIGGTMGSEAADKLIGDFLNVLQQKLLVHLQRYGPAQIEWCFTEPGCWNDQGRLDFRTTIQDRMFNGHARNVSFVSEAEAAAEYTALEGANRGLIQVSSSGSSEDR